MSSCQFISLPFMAFSMIFYWIRFRLLSPTDRIVQRTRARMETYRPKIKWIIKTFRISIVFVSPEIIYWLSLISGSQIE